MGGYEVYINIGVSAVRVRVWDKHVLSREGGGELQNGRDNVCDCEDY